MTAAARFALLLALVGFVAAQPASATWSIVIADSRTQEVAVGTVTCLEAFDLVALVPVVVVGKGAGACQAAGDFNGARRPIIFNGLKNGLAPAQILAQLAAVSGHASRQYGIVDTLGRSVTFTGEVAMPWAGGVTGSAGPLHYAIQGNILTGPCVADAIEFAVLNTPGDIPARLMAGMEAARDAGGDGRCSCALGATACGCPPPVFAKSGHIGGMVVARVGDELDDNCNVAGCADGRTYMRLNVTFQTPADPDPVVQLREQYDRWRDAKRGLPDAIRSRVLISPSEPRPPGGGHTDAIRAPELISPAAVERGSTYTMRVELRDLSGGPITDGGAALRITHERDSAGLSSIDRVRPLGGGAFEATLTVAGGSGVDRFRVITDDGDRPIVLAPMPTLVVGSVPGKAVGVPTGDASAP